MLIPQLHHYKLTDFALQSGVVVPKLLLAYRCYGELNKEKNNVIVLPTHYAGTDLSYAMGDRSWIGPGKALDTKSYFIVVPNLFGNGESSSPSNMPSPFNGASFPAMTIFDNVRAQSLLLESLGVRSVELVLGWSMGGLQAYQWCAQYPDRVKRALVICASAKTSPHNQVFLSGLRSCIEADRDFNKGDYDQQPKNGLKSFGRVYAGWAYSQTFFRQHRYREMGFQTLEALLVHWEQDHLSWDANNLLAMLDTWMTADISRQENDNGDLRKTLQSLKANICLMPCEQDLYFRFEDNEIELKDLKNGLYRGFESDFGHCAAAPGRFELESTLVEKVIQEVLSKPALSSMD